MNAYSNRWVSRQFDNWKREGGHISNLQFSI